MRESTGTAPIPTAQPFPPRSPSRSAIASLLADQRQRWQRGERIRVEDYGVRDPRVPANAEAILQLIYNEVILREQQGEAPQLAEYLQRFPNLADPLRLQFEVDQAIQSERLFQSALRQTETAAHFESSALPVAGEEVSIPNYEILGVLGQGGMGIVFQALQMNLRRVVALKMVRAGSRNDQDRLARVRIEAEAAARLQHPHIVQIYEVGECAGRPYLALEYVDGGSLAQRLEGNPLPAHQVAPFMEMLARAMDYAHQRGIIHRDLKPGNILLSAQREARSAKPIDLALDARRSALSAFSPKITDFGLAKLLDGGGEDQTLTGEILGTPIYMAPEQATGKTKESVPATDVYALGAILYELLTGRPPFLGESRLATLEQIRTQEPVSPRSLQPHVPQDLQTICLKCLQKEPHKRYASAAALAEDLRRFQASEPILARPSSWVERAGSWCRRNPTVAFLVGFVALLLMLISVGSVVAAVWLGQELRRTEKAEQEAEEAVAAAVQARDDLQQQKDRADTNLLITLGVLEKNLVDDKKADQQGWLGRKKRQELQEVLERFQVLREINSASPQMTQLRAQAYGQMAAVQEILGEYEQAEHSLMQARELQEALRRESPNNLACQHDLAGTLHDLGRVLSHSRRVREAEAAYRQAIQIHQRLVAVCADPIYRDRLARHFHGLGILLAADPARNREVREAYQQAIRLHEQLAAERPNGGYQEALNQYRYKLSVLEGVGLEDKEKASRKRVDELETLAAQQPASEARRHNLAVAYHELGKLLALKAKEAVDAAKKGKIDRSPEVAVTIQEAEDAYQRAALLDDKLARDYPDVSRYRRGLAQHYVGLGDLFLWTARQPRKAQAPYRAALDLYRELAPKDAASQGDLGCTYEKLAQMWLRSPESNMAGAREHLKKAVVHLQIALKTLPDNDHYQKILSHATKTLKDLAERKP
jgi:serine/threonine protein kinase